MRVSDIGVTVNAGEYLIRRLDREHLVDDVLMAVKARLLGHAAIPRFDLDRLVEILQREGQRMKKTVVPFGEPLPNRVMRKMAVIANGNVTVSRMLPRIVVALHHMTIGTTGWIVAQVAPAFTIAESERPDARKNAKHGRKQAQRESNQTPT
jgi:hypothetical protein